MSAKDAVRNLKSLKNLQAKGKLIVRIAAAAMPKSRFPFLMQPLSRDNQKNVTAAAI
jgi:hypothetical protein